MPVPKSENAKASSSKPRTAPTFSSTTPAFLSALKPDEIDFPRGGGSSLTALEVKQVRNEGKREADAEVAAEASKRPSKRVKRGDEREGKKRRSEAADKGKEVDKDLIRVEQLNYKRLSEGTHLLTRVHSVLPFHLIISLPNGLLAHVPITEVSTTLTRLLSASDSGSQSDEESDAPELSELFTPGQYLSATVSAIYPTASQTFVSQYPTSETTKLAARVECSLIPEKVNAAVARKDLVKGYVLCGEIKEEEDKGYRIALGLSAEDGPSPEGWLAKDGLVSNAQRLVPGQVVRVAVASTTAGGRVVQVTSDPETVRKAQLSEVTEVGSLLPGHAVSALITAVVPSGLNVKVCGFFDGTIDSAHLPLAGKTTEETYKVGKRIRCRILYDNLGVSPRRFVLSALPHILAFSSPTLPGGSQPVEEAVPIGKTVNSVKITRVIPEWGVFCRSDDGMEGFVHISHVSDQHVPALSGSTGAYRIGTLHRARVVGHSPLDGVVLLSFAQKILDQVFMQVSELQIGQQLKGTITRLTDKALFVDISGSVSGVVFPLHYADIQLKHPEKRFKPGGQVRCRVWQLDASRNRVLLTLKKSLIDSELSSPADFTHVQPGQLTMAVVNKIVDKGCLVDLWGGMRAFVPHAEAREEYVANLSDVFFVGKAVRVRILEKHADTGRIVASVRRATGASADSTSAKAIELGDVLEGTVKAIHTEQIVLDIRSAGTTALLSLNNLAKHRKESIDDLRSTLRVGEALDRLKVVKKNDKGGVLIVSIGGKTPAATEEDSNPAGPIQEGQVLRGTVLSTSEQGTMVSLPGGAKGRIHPCDLADDLSLAKSPKEGKDIQVYILAAHTKPRSIDLSARASRVQPNKASAPADPEVDDVKLLKPGDKIRGLVRSVAPHGLFVSLGRHVVARVKIRELFDEFVEDWKSKFSVGQLASGSIISVDATTGQVEMSLRSDRLMRGGKTTATAQLFDFTQGQKVDAVVKRVETYGLFLRIDGTEVSGLCHRSELSNNKKQDVSQALKGFREGDRVRAVLIVVDTEKGKVNFSIKASHFADEVSKEDDDDDAEVDGGDEDEEMDGEDGEMDEDEDEDEDESDVEEEGEDADEEEEDGEGDEDDDDEEEEEDDSGEDTAEDGNDVDAPAVAGKSSKAGGSALSLAGGFDWSGKAQDTEAAEEDSASESEDDTPAGESSARTTKSRQVLSTLNSTATDGEDRPSSASEFERALLASPNSSFLWIQYMSFLLQLHEVDRARTIGRQALERIAYREEAEKLNVWMALINLELGFGTPEQADKVWKEASERNDKREVFQRYAEALSAAGKDDAAEDVLKKLVKKFGAYPEAWAKHAEFYMKKGDLQAARALLPRSMQSLDKTKHVEMIEMIALLEFKHGEAERGKTLFEGLVDRYPKRLDLWNVYVDQLVKTGDVGAVRAVVDRTLGMKLTTKRAKFVFKKWLAMEQKIGDQKGQDKAKEKAREWVAANAQDGEE